MTFATGILNNTISSVKHRQRKKTRNLKAIKNKQNNDDDDDDDIYITGNLVLFCNDMDIGHADKFS